MKFFVYMLKSNSTGRHYYGHNNNLKYRLNEHNTGLSPHTRGKGPWNLIGYMEFESRSGAMKIENKLKKMKNPSRAKNWLSKNGVGPGFF